MFERLSSKSVIDPATVERVAHARTGVPIGVNKPFYRAMFGHSNDLIIPFQGDLDTLTHAVLERGIFVKSGGGFSPRPSPGADATYTMFLEAYQDVAFPTGRLTPQEFLASRPSRLRKIYDLARQRNEVEWFDIDKEAITSGFVKVEKTKQACENVFDEGTVKAPVPRLINPRSPRYNCKLGCYTIACEHTIYANIGTMFGKPCIAKGMNMHQRAQALREQWDDFKDPVYVGMDASRFDQHTGRLGLEFEHKLLRLHFQGDKTLKWLQRAQLRNIMYGRTPDGQIRADLGDMRMSGDMNTALGNCVITSALLWMRVQELGIKAYAMVDGDDSGLIMEREDYDRYVDGAAAWFLEYGYTMIIEDPVDVFEKIVFCQTQPVYTSTGWRMVRDPRKALNNDYAGYQQCSNPLYVRQLFHSIGSAGMSLASGVPIMQEFYAMGMKLGTAPRRVKLMEMSLHGWHHLAKLEGKKKWSEVTTDARLSFWRAFDIAPHVQVAMEQEFRRMDFSFRVQQAPGSHQELLSLTALPIAAESF